MPALVAGIHDLRFERVKAWMAEPGHDERDETIMARLQRARRRIEPMLRRGLHLYWWFSRGLTLGVRGLVIDDQDRVFLVKHSYAEGWHLPGGGVEIGETIGDALARELSEEGNIALAGAPRFYHLYYNPHGSRRDHVALFIIREFERGPPKHGREIIDSGFFPRTALPPDTTAGTRRRIAEVMEDVKLSDRW